jgi:hypothetical protein
LRQYVGEMDERVRKHLEMLWHGKQKVSVWILSNNRVSAHLWKYSITTSVKIPNCDLY